MRGRKKEGLGRKNKQGKVGSSLPYPESVPGEEKERSR